MSSHCIYSWFLESVRRFPDHLAIESPAESVSYSQLDQQVNALAALLIDSQIPAGSVMAVLSYDSLQVIIAILAILRAGCVFVPLDPAVPAARLRSMLLEAAPRCLLLDPTATFDETIWAGLVSPAVVISLGRRDSNPVPGAFAKWENCEGRMTPAIRPRGPDDLCYIYFTSGSTGKAKGIAGRLMAIRHFIEWEISTFGIDQQIRVSQLIPPAFDAFLRDMFVPLCAGGVLCIPPRRGILMEPRSLVDWIHNSRIGLIHTVPSLFRSILQVGLVSDLFPYLQYVLLAGEVLSPADVQKWTSIFGNRIQLVNLYGPSETTMVKFFHRVQPGDENRRSIPIGKPISGAAAVVVDSFGNVCPPGVIGELYIRTPFRSLGYYNQPELTRQSFIPNPFGSEPNDIVYKTGDLARMLSDGIFEFAGRLDQQVKIGGVRVEIDEIENLLRTMCGISDVAVVVRKNPGGDDYLCAYIAGDRARNSAELRKTLAAYLPGSMIPRTFITVPELPRTPGGKIDRKELTLYGGAQPAAEQTFVEAQTDTERQLVEIWRTVLDRETIGIDDDFFAIGGHSLAAIQVLARITARYGVELSVRDFFRSPTVRMMGEQVELAMIVNSRQDCVGKVLERLEQVDDDEARRFRLG